METNDKTTAMPTLTLDPFGAQAAAEQQTAAAEPVKTCDELMQENSNLSADELAAVDAFAKQIDITNSAQIMCYGADGQKKMADFSEGALENVRTKDLGQTGDMITDLIGELRGFDAAADEKGFLGFFRKKSAKVSALKAKYDKAEVNVERIAGELEKHQITLLKDVSMLDKMYEENLLYFKQLTMYILAGKKKLETERATTLPALVRKAEQSGLPEDAQKARDFADMCTRFEKKIYDLELTRNISIQMAPQIRLIQNNDTMMVEKIQTTIVNTIPLWKSQMVIALGLEHSRQAVEPQCVAAVHREGPQRCHGPGPIIGRCRRLTVAGIRSLQQIHTEAALAQAPGEAVCAGEHSSGQPRVGQSVGHRIDDKGIFQKAEVQQRIQLVFPGIGKVFLAHIQAHLILPQQLQVDLVRILGKGGDLRREGPGIRGPGGIVLRCRLIVLARKEGIIPAVQRPIVNRPAAGGAEAFQGAVQDRLHGYGLVGIGADGTQTDGIVPRLAELLLRLGQGRGIHIAHLPPLRRGALRPCPVVILQGDLPGV